MEAVMAVQPLVTRSQVISLATSFHTHSSAQSTWQRATPSLTTTFNAQKHHPKRHISPICVANSTASSQVATETPRDARVASEPAPSDLAGRWREIQGSNDWKGLLNPLDRTLREEILRYGEFTQATYDTFDFDDHSKYCGSARYNKANMFEKVGLVNTGYEVTRYFYATANTDLPFFFKKPVKTANNEVWSKDSNWMGYVAVCTDEKKIKQLGRRDIVIAWRGTIRNSEWAANFKVSMGPATMDERATPGGAAQQASTKVETGFLSLYTSKNPNTRYNKSSARTQVLTELKRLVEKYEGEQLSITVTGHSLGSALATLNAYDIAQSGLNQPGKHVEVPTEWGAKSGPPANPDDATTIPVTVFSFAGPRVGNDAFRDRLAALGVKVLRLVNANDFVPRVPGLFVDETPGHENIIEKFVDQFPFTYTHVGVEVQVNNNDSPFLAKDRANKGNVHNLEQYLHLIDGHQGAGRPFQLTTGRQVALVNKSCDFVKPENGFPECWWQQENKGLVRQPDGMWVQPERNLEDIPTADTDFS